MNCEIISNIKPEVTSPIPSCRRGTITTQGHAHIQSSPYRGSQRGSQGRWDDYHARACTHPVLPLQGESEGVTRKVGRLTRKGMHTSGPPPTGGVRGGHKGGGTITTQGHAHIQSSPYRGSQRGSQGRWDDYHARDSAFM